VRARATVIAVMATFGTLAIPAPASAAFEISDFYASPFSAPAGSHPDSTVHMEFGGTVDEDVRNIIQHFPGGIIPNPEALPKCTDADIAGLGCPPASELGDTTLTARPDIGLPIPPLDGKVYNYDAPPPYVGGLVFVVAGSSLKAPFTVRSARHNADNLTTALPDVEADTTQPVIALTARDYGLTGLSKDVPFELDLPGGLVQPEPIKIDAIEYTLDGTPPTATGPYLTTTTACLSSRPKLEATSWDGQYHSLDGEILSGTNCAESDLPYAPEDFDVAPDNTRTDTPSGYDVSVNIPADEDPKHQPYLKRGSITFPPGTALSPPAAQGLEGCADAQFGIGAQAAPTCPAGSDIGDVIVESKNVDHVINGDFYLGQPTTGHTYRVFMAFPIVSGLWVKLDGESFPDSVSGQITTVFDDLPMLPFEKFTISLDGGDRAVLVNPPTCGTHTLTSTLTPWSGATTFPAERDEHPTGSFTASYDGAGAACPDPFPFEPSVAGSTTPLQAGANSNLSLTLSNPDRHQLLKTLKTSLPPGLVGSIVGIPLCSVNAAATGSCAAGSRIGSVSTVVGSGNDPLPLPGSIYLAEPLQDDDPASLSIVVPAKAGPFDFGNVVIRARIVLRSDVGLDVALVDDLPRIIGGIPIRLRTAGVSIDRSNFIRNPSSCAQLQLGASFTALGGAGKTAAVPYQASGCASLAFSPELRLIATGETKKDGHPGLRAILTQPPGQANIATSRVVLPDIVRPEVSALNRPGGLCQEAQLAARACPAGSQVGTATATTPLLPAPLAGPVYIVQHAGNPLPKLVVFLDGRVSIRLEAQNEFERLSIVNRFDAIPDVAVSRFELKIKEKGILRSYGNLCAKLVRGRVAFTAHSGRKSDSEPRVEVSGCRPKASVTLGGVRSGKPSLKVRVRRSPSGAKLRGLTLTLPRSLRADLKAARKGLRVTASKKLRRSNWRLTRRGVLSLRKLPTDGLSTITVTLRKGVLEPSTALRKASRKRKRPRVAFKLRVTDTLNQRLRITVRIRPRS